MRPKLFALIAVSAFALVGCGAAEQAQPLDVEPSPSSSASPSETSTQSPNVKKEASPTFSKTEENFLVFAETRAENLGISDLPSDKKLVQQFNEFCDSGDQIEISKVEDLNTNMEKVAESTFCAMRD